MHSSRSFFVSLQTQHGPSFLGFSGSIVATGGVETVVVCECPIGMITKNDLIITWTKFN